MRTRGFISATLGIGLLGVIAYWLIDWINGYGRTPWLQGKMQAAVNGDLWSLVDVLVFNLIVYAVACATFLAFIGLAKLIGGTK